MNSIDFDKKCEEAQEEIMAISDRYRDYISEITIKWKENEDEGL